MRGFAKWLKETRIDRGMTQAELARSNGVSFLIWDLDYNACRDLILPTANALGWE